MNLNAIVAPAVRAINPPVQAMVSLATGYTTGATGKRTPTYGAAIGPVAVDVQSLSGRDLMHLDALNLQGVMRAAYFNGSIEGLDRPAGKGGDMLAFNNETWLITQVLEPWDSAGWVKVAITLQMP